MSRRYTEKEVNAILKDSADHFASFPDGPEKTAQAVALFGKSGADLIPILDGGMILFLLIETIMRRDVNQQVKERIYQVAFVCILAFFAFVIFNDLTRLNLFTKLKP